MAYPTARLLRGLQDTIARLTQSDAPYNWCHQGHCNCGHLAQSLTQYDASQIHHYAIQKRGDWDQHTLDHCTTSQHPIDWMISDMLQAGLSLTDLRHLERLSDPQLLARMPLERRRNLNYKNREDLVYYLRTWQTLLLEQLAEREAPELPAAEMRETRAVLV
jgi:hypothetical protein